MVSMTTPSLREEPAYYAFAITPDDDANLAHVTRGLFVGAGGTVVAVFQDGGTVTFDTMATGQTYDLQVERILDTGTSAEGLVGLY